MKKKSFLKHPLVVLIALFTVLSASTAHVGFGKTLKTVRLGVGYIPDIQFAPLYVSQTKGYYQKEGLKVIIEYGFENDFVALAAQNEREFAVAAGDQVVLARGQGLPITYIMKWYERYPVALVSPQNKGITSPKHLLGKKVGLPGFFGTSYIGWKALLYANDIDEKSLTVKKIGFTQAVSLQQNLVDVAMGYIANEPEQLRAMGIDVHVIEVSDYISLVSNGLVAGDTVIKKNPDLVKRMVRATLKGLQDTIQNPKEALAITRRIIPEITDKQVPVLMKTLKISVDLCKTDRLGFSRTKDWEQTANFLYQTGMLKKKSPVNRYFTNQFVD